MLAGILLDLCLAPMRAIGAIPALALPVVLAWAVMLRLSRLWAVPAALAVAVAALLMGPGLPAGLGWSAPAFVWVTPRPEWSAAFGIGVPLFLVTMASQNLPGLAVLQANGYGPPLRPVLVGTGFASGMGALFGGQLVNLAAITAALCAGPDAHPDPRRRWVAAAVGGIGYLALAFCAGAAAEFAAAAPPLLIQSVAGSPSSVPSPGRCMRRWPRRSCACRPWRPSPSLPPAWSSGASAPPSGACWPGRG
jgi:benzoate membrane transport protein